MLEVVESWIGSCVAQYFFEKGHCCRFWAWLKGCTLNQRTSFTKFVAVPNFLDKTFFDNCTNYDTACENLTELNILSTQWMRSVLERHLSPGTEEMMAAPCLVRPLFSSPSINDRYSEEIPRICDEPYATPVLSFRANIWSLSSIVWTRPMSISLIVTVTFVGLLVHATSIPLRRSSETDFSGGMSLDWQTSLHINFCYETLKVIQIGHLRKERLLGRAICLIYASNSICPSRIFIIIIIIFFDIYQKCIFL